MTRGLSRPPLAALLYAGLLAGMAAGQLAGRGAFRRALESYDVLAGLAPAASLALPAVELAAAAGLLASRSLPRAVALAAGGVGLAVAAVWAGLAAQAFARGLAVENCGCFGPYLAQELRWWVLLEDAYFLVLAALAARSAARARLGGPQPPSSRGVSRSRSITRSANSGSAGGSSRPSPRSESTVASTDR